ncbi:BlaI/MecI/CopY family transcriptional regulator [Anoxybacterium hadale]|uniref:BlaI/MecI/CopY family transcriptional regulator n=1 Tax=Anoxybacterium hadale TaxID=3408580 RepID=A0ACD1AF92_9FIRM|nr:BlaI/MecI/CopY family transcriptional regulator [Clostridiales bacterium]
MNKLPQISEAEYEVMKIIWDQAPINTNEIVELLSKTKAWSPKTMQTMMIRLEKKGAVCHEKQGRLYFYSPMVRKEDYVDMESRSFLNRFYNGTLKSMVSSFIENDKLSDEDIHELKELLSKKK